MDSIEEVDRKLRFWTHCRTATTILIWYLISSCIILLTKWLFTTHFSFPLTVTTFSNTIASVWALLVSFHPRFHVEKLSRERFLRYVLPIGMLTALEIGSSNVALKILSVSFGTILKGGGPVFTFLWGLVLGVEEFSGRVLFALVFIALGIALASLGEGGEFHPLGFSLQLLSSALGGLRWAMTHKLLKASSDEPLSPLAAVLYTSPLTSLCVLPVALALEGPVLWQNPVDSSELPVILLTMTSVATLVFLLLMSEYWLVNATSSLALSVAGVFKELLTIGGGILFLAETVDALNVIGFLISQIGILSYIWLRFDKKSSETYAPVGADSRRGEDEKLSSGIELRNQFEENAIL